MQFVERTKLKIILIVAIIISLFFTIYSFIRYNSSNNQKYKIVKIYNQHLNVEIASDNLTRAKGLSDREILDKNSGMLFTFPSADYHRFWMKDMHFPLDFIWIKDNIVVDLTQNVPYPKNNDENLEIITPKEPSNNVLEVNAGKILEWNIKIGDVVEATSN